MIHRSVCAAVSNYRRCSDATFSRCPQRWGALTLNYTCTVCWIEYGNLWILDKWSWFSRSLRWFERSRLILRHVIHLSCLMLLKHLYAAIGWIVTVSGLLWNHWPWCQTLMQIFLASALLQVCLLLLNKTANPRSRWWNDNFRWYLIIGDKLTFYRCIIVCKVFLATIGCLTSYSTWE